MTDRDNKGASARAPAPPPAESREVAEQCESISPAGVRCTDKAGHIGGHTSEHWASWWLDAAPSAVAPGETVAAGKRRIYLASSWRNEKQPEVLARLRAAGHEVYDFRNPKSGNNGFSWKQCTDDPPPWGAAETIAVLDGPIAQAGLKLDFDAMKWCDTLVMLQPCGRSASLELGWGIGAGKRTAVLMADGQEPELMPRLADYLTDSIDRLLWWLAAGEPIATSIPAPPPPGPSEAREKAIDLGLGELREANLTRQSEWDREGKITLSYRGNELAGEVGEACNVIKKIERERLGIRGSRDTIGHAMEELADVVICVDLLASALGGNLAEAVRRKFNATSDKNGLKTKLACRAAVAAKEGK